MPKQSLGLSFFNRLSLSTRLIILVGFACSVLFTAYLAYNYQVTRQYIIQESQLKAQQTVSSTAYQLQTALNGVKKSSDYLASVIHSSTLTPSQLETLLRNNFSSNSQVLGAAIALNPKFPGNKAFAPYYFHGDNSILFADISHNGNAYTKLPWFTQSQRHKKPFWSEPYFQQTGAKQFVVSYNIPVFKLHQGQQKLYAVVKTDVSLALINAHIQSAQLGQTGVIILSSKAGKILSHPNAKLLGSPITNNQHHEDWQPLQKALLAGKSVNQSVACVSQPGQCLLAFAPLEKLGWPLIVLYPEKELLQELSLYTQQTIISSVAILTLLLGLIAFSLRQQLKPLAIVSESAKKIGQGQFQALATHKRHPKEIALLVNAFNQMQTALAQHVQKLQQETGTRKRLEGELKAAHDIQMAMLPENGQAFYHDKQLEIWAKVVPAKSVGGDFYQYATHGNSFYFAIGDVSDKGTPAALLMAKVSSLVQQSFVRHEPISDTVAAINQQLCQNNDSCMFTTMVYGQLELNTGLVRFVNAGHQAPLVLQGNVFEASQQSGPALGLIEHSHYLENQLQLQAGDGLMLFTDGLEESFNAKQQMLGLKSITQLLEKNLKQNCQSIGQQALALQYEFSSEDSLRDDTSLLILRYQPQPLFLLSNYRIKSYQRFSLPATLEGLMVFFEQLETFCQQQQISQQHQLELQLIGEEIISNAINHGNINKNDSIFWQLGQTACQGFLLQVEDTGTAFNPLTEAAQATLGLPAEDTTIGQLGVYLVKSLTSVQYYQRKNAYNQICFYKPNERVSHA